MPVAAPVTVGICLLTARAVNQPGAVAVAVRGAAIIVYAGAAPCPAGRRPYNPLGCADNQPIGAKRLAQTIANRRTHPEFGLPRTKLAGTPR